MVAARWNHDALIPEAFATLANLRPATGHTMTQADPPSGLLRPGLRVYAIGDIHGHADLLGRMATLVAADAAGAVEPVTVFVGDYVDRGPDSTAVIDRLRRGDFPTAIVTLRGNHEQMMLDALDGDDEALRTWLSNGGVETAMSYGVGTAALHDGDLDRFRRDLIEAMPAAHLAFLQATVLSHTIDGYYFCHAGIEPGVPFAAQDAAALLWIRGPFHRSTRDHGKVVVHGHTPVRKPESLPNRINIDTGAFHSGRLSCVVLEGSDRRFLST